MAEYIAKDETFVIKDYLNAVPFASFLPSIAGAEGIPLYAFYVNRGQGIACFGSDDKDGAIMDFLSANIAYRDIDRVGFRTFLKLDGEYCECFRTKNTTMTVGFNSLEIAERNEQFGYEIIVKYFILPYEIHNGLIRRVYIKNISNSTREFEVADGMAEICSYGMTYDERRSVSYLMNAYHRIECSSGGIMLFKKNATTDDTAVVFENKIANYYFSADGKGNKLRKVCDPDLIFGDDTTLSHAHAFIKGENKEEYLFNKKPCCFSIKKARLLANEILELNTAIGKCESAEVLTYMSRNFSLKDYFDKKYNESEHLINEILKPVQIKSAFPNFDAYIKNSYLDNILRGGMPKKVADKHFYIYSRKHGDLERDYNPFSIKDEFFSCGNGNYRDINQNRRMDNFFHSDIKEHNIVYFLSFIGLDGYNPLNIQTPKLTLNGDTKTAGELYAELLKKGKADEFERIVESSVIEPSAVYAEGYWTDHFIYNLDLIENYLRLYPDSRSRLLNDTYEYKYFNTGVRVRANAGKIISRGESLRQNNFLNTEHEKSEFLKLNGAVLKTNLIIKLTNLALSKFLNLDRTLTGIEMEAGKPGWCDALNGLPGLFGSSVADSFELFRLLKFILENLDDIQTKNLNIFSSSLKKLKKNPSYNDLQCNKDELRKNIYENNFELEKVSLLDYKPFLQAMYDTLQEKLDFSGKIPPSYRYFTLAENGFSAHDLPPFLEGVVKAGYYLDKTSFRSLNKLVHDSELYDKQLGLYKTSVSLENEGIELGRLMQFTAGYLERESFFTHMGFKYLLMLLKKGLYSEFYSALESNLPCFMRAEVYGRSIYENCSFIATSNNPEKNIVGRGYYARLTGANAEILNILSIMQLGHSPFVYEKGALAFAPKPVLHNSFFDESAEYSFNFFSTQIIIKNQKRINTYEANEPSELILIKGNTILKSSSVCTANAERIRNGYFDKIIITY